MKITDRVYYRKMYFSIPLRECSAPRLTYATLLVGDKVVLVDSGVSYHYPDLQELVAEAGVKISDISMVINTHCHPDHAGGNYALRKANPSIIFLAHEKGKPLIEDIDSQYKIRPVPGFYNLMGGPVPIDHCLEDGEELNVGFPVKVIHTPGHSPDSISLYLPQDDILICGDSIPYDRDVPIYDDLDTFKDSLKKMAPLKPRYILSALGGFLDKEKEGDVFDRAFAYLDKIQTLVNSFVKQDSNASMDELARFVLQSIKVESPVIPFIIRSLQEHLKKIE